MCSYDPLELDRLYDNRNWVPDFDAHLRSFGQRTALTLAEHPCIPDVAYGAGLNESMDIYPADKAGAPILFFIHAGYWRALDKRDFGFIAPAFTRQGVSVFVPNYALCPSVTVADIVMQMVKALAWVYKNAHSYGADTSRIVVVGHSAGGHLTAMMRACQWQAYDAALPPDLIRGALAISGLYDLGAVMHTPSLQSSLHLTEDLVQRVSPAFLPGPDHGQLHVIAGADESPEFLRNARLIRDAWGAANVPVAQILPGMNHLNIVDALADRHSQVHAMAMNLI
jgi:arylformamidase